MKRTHKKVRPEAILKTAAAELQNQLWEFLAKHSYTDGSAWLLSEHGIKAAITTIRDWRNWYSSQLVFRQFDQRQSSFEELLKKHNVELSQDKLDDIGNLYFRQEALAGMDAQGFAALQLTRKRIEDMEARRALEEKRLAIKEREIALHEAKYRAAFATSIGCPILFKGNLSSRTFLA